MRIDGYVSFRQRMLVAGVIICFLLSGGVALVYQTLWVRMFTIVFGNTSYAVSTVLCAFMAGLGLGSWYFGKRIDKHPQRSILLYGILEIGIALSAFVIPHALRVTDKIHMLLYQDLVGSSVALGLLRFALAFAVLIVPTTLMGGTLPVLVRFFVKRREKLGAGVGTLYGVNTFGAVVGCFLTGFYLIGLLGVSRTLSWNIYVNLLVGVAAFVLYHLVNRTTLSETPETALESSEPDVLSRGEEENVQPVLRIILWFAALAGMTSLAYEVFWTRMLVFYMNNSTYAFSSMLTTLLLGLAVGGYVFGKVLDRRKNLWLWFAGFEFVIGIWAIFAFPVFDTLFHRLGGASRLFEANFWGVPTYVKLGKSAMLMLVPTLLMGAAFPLLSKLYTRNIQKLGRSVGNIYSKNTLGSMAGAFGAGFIVIPLLGIQKGVIAIAAVNIALALAAVWMSGVPAPRKRTVLAMMSVVAIVGAVITPKEIFFRRHDEHWNKLLFYEEDNTATVKVYDLPSEKRVISINGYEVAGAYHTLHEIQKALGHYPALIHHDPQSALVVGFGAGGTSWALNLHSVPRIDLVEIVPAVLKAAPYFEEVNHGITSSPNFHATIDDGRNYVHATQETYDIITVDSIDPKHAGNGNLYTVDFYRDCLSKLNPGGIMAQWIPYHLLYEQELKIIVKSFARAFPHHQLWFTPLYSYFILVGSPEEITVDYSRLAKGFNDPELVADFWQMGTFSPAGFLNTFAMDEAAIADYVSDTSRINSYDQPCIEFFGNYDFHTFGELPIASPKGAPILVNLGMAAEEKIAALHAIDSYSAITREIIKGRYFFTHKEYTKAANHWQEALALDPGNKTAEMTLSLARGVMSQELSRHLASLEQDPDNPLKFYELGNFYERINNRQAAVVMYRKAIELKPDFERAHNNLGLIYGEQGQYDRALGIFETALRINPFSLTAAYNLGIVYYLKGDYRKTEQICRKALDFPESVQDEELRTKIQQMLQLIGRAQTGSDTKAS